MASDPAPLSALSLCDLCGALSPWDVLIPLGQVDFVTPTTRGHQLVGSRPLRGCPPPWRHDSRLHQAVLEWAPLRITRPGPFTRRSCRIGWQDLSPEGPSRPPHRRRRRRREAPAAPLTQEPR